MLIEGSDYFVRLVAFPIGVGTNGLVLLNDDGTYSIYLNARASRDAQRQAMKHEINHIINGDLHGSTDICDIEEALLCRRKR